LRYQKNSYDLYKGGNAGSSAQMDMKLETVNLPNSIDSTDGKYLLKVKELAEVSGIELVLITAPIYQDRQAALKNGLSAFSNEFWNPSDFEVNTHHSFQDHGHLNQEGRIDFTNKFSRQLLMYL
jgi:hypothetical protein